MKSDLSELNAHVSRRLKELRTGASLSLDALAKLSGVSKGMLVEIEKSAANPSIGILCKVAAALSVSVADLVTIVPRVTIHAISPTNIPVLWQGPLGGEARLLAGSQGPDMLELWRWTLQPGECHEAAAHHHGALELLHVEAGALRLRVGLDEAIVKAGHSAIAYTDQPHSYANDGCEPLTFLMTVAERPNVAMG
jgi:transcriptional regulator with XRE-family HTH domain